MGGIIAVLIVMIVINAFLVYAIVRSWERVNEKIDAFFVNKTSDFNSVNNGLQQSEQESVTSEKVIIKQKPVYVVSDKVDNTSYQNIDFKENYKKLKAEMSFNKQKIVSEIVEQDGNEISKFGKAAIKLSEDFTFDTIYQLSTLSSSEQLNIVQSSIDNDEKELLEQYYKNSTGYFNVVEFFDYVHQLAKSEDPNYYVRTGWKNENYDNQDKNVVTVYDGDIIEGVKIVHKDKVYDYSI